MLARVNELSSEFRRVSKMQVVQTTRQIILENVRLNNQMGLVETDYTDVEAKNGKIRDEVRTSSISKLNKSFCLFFSIIEKNECT
jgi:hypothetical protein